MRKLEIAVGLGAAIIAVGVLYIGVSYAKKRAQEREQEQERLFIQTHLASEEDFLAEFNKTGDLDEPDEPAEPGGLRAGPSRAFNKKHYPKVSLADLVAGKWRRPRCQIEGTVKYIKLEDDGDYHFVVSDGTSNVVCEIIPEYALDGRRPKAGMKVRVYGIPREDKQHGWWEVHPVIEWEEI